MRRNIKMLDKYSMQWPPLKQRRSKMTKDDIAQLKPGQEMNVLVAEEIMHLPHEPGCPAIADDESDSVLADYQDCCCERHNYSMDITFAMEVANKILEMGFHWWIVNIDENETMTGIWRWAAHVRRFKGSHTFADGYGKELPEAICKAGLKAIFSLPLPIRP